MGSTFTRYKSPALVNLDFHATFTAALLRKDFDLGLAAAREHEVPMPVASLVHQIVQSLVGNGFGEQDFATVLELQARSSGLALASEDAEVSDGLEPAGRPGGRPGQQHAVTRQGHYPGSQVLPGWPFTTIGPFPTGRSTGNEITPASRPVSRRWRERVTGHRPSRRLRQQRHQLVRVVIADPHRRFAVADRRLLRRRPGLPARLRAMGK